MARLGTLALGVLAVMLAGTVALELRASRKSAPALPVALAQEATSTDVKVSAVADQRDRAWGDTVLARPVFSPSRRPPSVARVAQKSAVQAKLPRLAGIMVDGARRSVIFAPVGDRKPIIVAEGGEFDGFRVERIEAGGVTVSGPGVRQILRPSFDLSAAPPQPVVAPPVPIAPPVVQGATFNGPPGLAGMPPIVATGAGPVTPTLPGLPSLSNLTGIPGLNPPAERPGH